MMTNALARTSRATMRLVATAALASAAGCASLPPDAPRSERDPLERVNRGVFAFNDALDRNVAKPLARAYDAVVPDLLKLHVSNFFSNVSDVMIGVNNLLQGKPREAASDAGRVVVNTLFGFLGLVDIASEVGLPKHREDFGQTLGRWGMPSGPYLVLPFFGPSNVRDGLGLTVDLSADPLIGISQDALRNQLVGTRLVDARYRLLGAERAVEGLAFDRYTFIRDAFLQRRRSLVWDGEPPEEEDDALPPEEDYSQPAPAESVDPPPVPASPTAAPDAPAPAR